MKKLFTLLLLALTAFGLGTKAQVGTNCNADFSFTVSGLTASFTPVQPGDSLFTQHSWNFGDGSPLSSLTFTSHTYASGGSYLVKHVVKRLTPNGAIACSDTVAKIVTITTSQPCNLQANFSFVVDSIQTSTVYFSNTTVNFLAGDSIRWTFGDGTTSFNANPVHTYSQPGTYTVCLRVKRNTPPGTVPCVSEICKVVTIQAQPCNLQAYFTWFADSLQYNKIYFNNATVNFQPGDSIRWTFGDGTTSFATNPVHVYTQPGVYTVCLRVKRNTPSGAVPCISEICRQVIVQQPCNILANFTWKADSVQVNKIIFTNTSSNFQPGDSIRWTFGDGSSSFDVNPVHVYNQPGIYTVCLRIKRNSNTGGAPCVSEICKQVVVQNPCNLQANFNWRADSLQPNKIFFINTTGGFQPGDSIRWTFGDGTSSFDVNPVHIYAQPGTYTVCLRVKRNTASGTPCVSEICKQVTVQAPPCNILVNFSWVKDSVNIRKVYFTNLTVTPTAGATATWSFGDGTSATSWNAVHEYAQPGTYVVCLTVKTSNTCIRSKCDTITITAPMPPCRDLSKFTFSRSTSDNQTYIFRPNYLNPSLQYTWTFGDGTGSQSMVASHRYAQPGTYTVCLTVYKNNNCASTTCQTITVLPQVNCNNINVTYTYQRDALMPNKIYFYAISNFPILQQRWTITKLPATTPSVTLFQNNPVYVFQDTGTYRVCLRAITMGGCIKEYCQNIVISNTGAQCQLQAYPNPATSVVNVNVQLTQPEMIYAYVYNAQNVLVLQKQQQGTTGNNIVSLNVANLVPGQYTIKLIYGNRTCYAKFQKL